MNKKQRMCILTTITDSMINERPITQEERAMIAKIITPKTKKVWVMESDC